MSTAKPLVLEPEKLQAIRASVNQFDLNAPLTDDEILMMGQLAGKPQPVQSFTPAHDIEEDTFEENVQPVNSESDYNAQYAYYLKCQNVVTLVSFEDGWESFKQLVLNAFLREQKLANKDYRGTNPHRASALRLREQAAEDFVKFVSTQIQALREVPKPVLKQQS